MSFRERELARRLSPWVKPGQTVLDVGSGSGALARELARSTGVAPTLCDVNDYNKADLPYIKLDDPLHIPATDGSFDVVLLAFVLHHIPERAHQAAVVSEAMRIAARRLLVLEDTPRTRLERAFNVAWDWALNAPNGVPTPFTFRSIEAWTEELSRDGYRVTSVKSFRGLWPTLATYHQSLIVVDRASPEGF